MIDMPTQLPPGCEIGSILEREGVFFPTGYAIGWLRLVNAE